MKSYRLLIDLPGIKKYAVYEQDGSVFYRVKPEHLCEKVNDFAIISARIVENYPSMFQELKKPQSECNQEYLELTDKQIIHEVLCLKNDLFNAKKELEQKIQTMELDIFSAKGDIHKMRSQIQEAMKELVGIISDKNKEIINYDQRKAIDNFMRNVFFNK